MTLILLSSRSISSSTSKSDEVTKKATHLDMKEAWNKSKSPACFRFTEKTSKLFNTL